MPLTVVVGAQWGDEGKGKIVDLLAEHADVVARYQGGNNAGHTLVIGEETYKLRLVPSGILYPGKLCLLGNGCVIDPEVLIEELDGLIARGIDVERPSHLGERPPDHAVAPDHRRRLRARARAAPDRHDPARDRAGVRRQGPARRDPRAGPARREDPAAQDPDRALGQERAPAKAPPPPAARQGGADRRDAGLRRADLPVHRRHVARARPGARRRPLGAGRGRAGDAARHRPRHLPVRHVVEPDRRRGVHGPRRRPDADRPRPRRDQGVRDARRRGAVPERGRRRARRGDPRARRRVRHRHRPRPQVRVARPGRASLRGAGERAHRAGRDEARRPLDARVDPGLHRLPPLRRHGDDRLPRPPDRLPPRQAGLPELDGWGSDISAVTTYDGLPAAAKAYLELVESEVGVPIAIVGTGARRDQTIVVRELQPAA